MLETLDRLAPEFGIERVLATLGNYEPWNQMTPQIADQVEPVQISSVV